MPSEPGSHGMIGDAATPYCGDNYCQVIQPRLNEYCAQLALPCDAAVPQISNGQLCYCYCSCAPAKTCLENIAEKLPPRPCSPEHCASQQAGVNAHCGQRSLPCNTPVQQKDEQGKCWCCCACATASTVIAVAGGYRLIETVKAGEKVLATGARMDGWAEREVHEIGDLPAGAPRDDFYFAQFRLADGEDRFMLVMADLLLLSPAGTLKPVAGLRPGDEVTQADGGRASLLSLTREEFGGGLRTVSLGPFEPDEHPDDPYRDHLINLFGLVTADLAVQTAFYTDNADAREEDDDDR